MTSGRSKTHGPPCRFHVDQSVITSQAFAVGVGFGPSALSCQSPGAANMANSQRDASLYNCLGLSGECHQTSVSAMARSVAMNATLRESRSSFVAGKGGL